MPAPQSSEITNLAKSALQSKGLQGENAPDLGEAIGETCGAALQLFMAQAMVMPGIPAAAPPPPGAGATAGPGMLMPPPAGGPGASLIEPLASGFLAAKGIRGENAPDLADALADTLNQTLTQMMSRLQVTPGIPCSPGASAGPGRLV